MRLMRTLTAAAAVAGLLLVGGTSASAAPITRPGNAVGHLIRQHQCVKYDQPMPGPIAGYLVRDTANPSRGLFYKDSGSFTSGMMVGWGGTLELRYQCRR